MGNVVEVSDIGKGPRKAASPNRTELFGDEPHHRNPTRVDSLQGGEGRLPNSSATITAGGRRRGTVGRRRDSTGSAGQRGTRRAEPASVPAAESVGAKSTVLETVEMHELDRYRALERADGMQVEVLPAKTSKVGVANKVGAVLRTPDDWASQPAGGRRLVQAAGVVAGSGSGIGDTSRHGRQITLSSSAVNSNSVVRDRHSSQTDSGEISS